MNTTPRVTFFDVPPDGRLQRIARFCEVAFSRGQRLQIHCDDPEESRAIDDLLWTFRDDVFIPHEIVDTARGATPKDATCPVAITSSGDRLNAAQVLIVAAETSLEAACAFDSVVEFVDHRSPERMTASRARYKAWRDAGHKPDYRKE